VTHWWEDFKPADTAYSLEKAREILDNLYGTTTAPLAIVGDGACNDCNRIAVLLEYRHVNVCRRCASSRARAAHRDAA